MQTYKFIKTKIFFIKNEFFKKMTMLQLNEKIIIKLYNIN